MALEVSEQKNCGGVVLTFVGHPWVYDITGQQCPPYKGSQIRYNKAHGAMIAYASETQLEMCFYNVDGDIVDHFTLA
jgi:hypothetical protein